MASMVTYNIRRQGHNSKPREPADLLTTDVPVCLKCCLHLAMSSELSTKAFLNSL